jgi:hypothetical protein
VKVPFELEWLGGAAERHFRKARPAVEALPWGTLSPADYSPSAIEFARSAWTEVAMNEYRAVALFCQVLQALVAVKAPLDLLGMTSGFLADECSHVELASRLAMELGGAAPRVIDPSQLELRLDSTDAMQRANELVLRVSSVAEAFAGGTASVTLSATTHPLPRAVYETILRDEAHHRRLGALYFEWALARIDERELRRLGGVLHGSLREFATFWRKGRAPAGPVPAAPTESELQALGWLAPSRFAEVARDVVVRDILDPLATIGICLSAEDRAALLASP